MYSFFINIITVAFFLLSWVTRRQVFPQWSVEDIIDWNLFHCVLLLRKELVRET